MSIDRALPHENPARPTELSTVLLADPDLELRSYRELLLSRSHYTVVTASNYREVFDLRGESRFRLAVLSSNFGELALRAAAEFIRRRWPSTRILILGSARPVLDDSLYDEAVDCRFQPQELLSVLERLWQDDWTLRSRRFGSPLELRRTSPFPVPPESDPRKVAYYKRIET